MLIFISLRNIIRNLDRNIPVLIALFASFMLLIVGNSIIYFISGSFRQLYTESLTADLSISKQGEDFSLFGNSTLIVGDFLPPPIIPDIEEIIDTLNESNVVNNWAGMLTLPTNIKAGTSSEIFIAFGVDFESYLELFPGIQLHSGSWPDGNGDLAYTMLQQHQYEALGEPPLGSRLLLTSTNGQSFTIRETVFSGIYTYPVPDSAMGQIFLTDANIVRALAGYISVQQDQQTISSKQQLLVESSIDDLFSAPQQDVPSGDLAEDVLQLSDIEGLLSVTPERTASRAFIKGAWNFLLIDSGPEYSFQQTVTELRKLGLTDNYRLLDWRSTAGGNVLIAFFLQVLINAGMGLILIAASLIIINSVSLSLLERRREIGTMRAVGTTKIKLLVLISVEICCMILPIVLLGVFAGALCINIINQLSITTENSYINLLLGGNALQGVIDLPLLFWHMGLGILLIVFCIPYPLSRVLKIQPAQAMA